MPTPRVPSWIFDVQEQRLGMVLNYECFGFITVLAEPRICSCDVFQDPVVRGVVTSNTKRQSPKMMDLER